MNFIPILSLIILLPLFGAFLLLFIGGSEEQINKNSKDVALWTSMSELVLVIILFFQFDSDNIDFQFMESIQILPDYGISYIVGVDSISLLFLLLASILIPICILISMNSIKVRVKEYMLAFLILESFIMGVFCSLDALLFYIFFESLLIPMFLIIGIWGGKRRIYAAFKFFLYTLSGSIFFLIAIIVMAYNSGSTSLLELYDYNFSELLQKWLWIGMFLSFAIKVPMWPFHTWLPDAHVEAPTAGSVILAGVLLKVGGYAFIRFSLPILPSASEFFSPFVMILGVIAIIYTSLIALMQTDIKKLIAYSSVAHMGYVTIGIFSLNEVALNGAVLQMISHGLVSSALFLCVGVLYNRKHSRLIADYSGLVKNMPLFSFFLMIFTLSSIGLPGTSGFVGEFLVILGFFKVNAFLATISALGVILGASYMLRLYKRIIFGPFINNNFKDILDLNVLELLVLSFLAFAIMFMGIYPTLLLDFIEYPLEQILDYTSIT